MAPTGMSCLSNLGVTSSASSIVGCTTCPTSSSKSRWSSSITLSNSSPVEHSVAVIFTVSTEMAADGQLQEERDALAKEVQGGPVERPRVRQRLSAPHVPENVAPPMLTLVPRELTEWMEDRES